jgi:hypothetical protein
MAKSITRKILEGLKKEIEAKRPDVDCRYEQKYLHVVGAGNVVAEITHKGDKIVVQFLPSDDRWDETGEPWPQRVFELADPGYEDQVVASLAEFIPFDPKRDRQMRRQREEAAARLASGGKSMAFGPRGTHDVD